MGIMESLQDFRVQSERVLAITHRPREDEYRQMALTTAIGMVLIGLVGLIIAMTAYFLRNGV
ncbi:Uncharacterised protein [Candidatus Norongarragalina meridionalis]|nr:Uncharacterised protein [Candidatus Norongarragalina meridionalis]